MERSILIESQWNLNFDEAMDVADKVPILIESQWNLNIVVASLWRIISDILIESQWNLNDEKRTGISEKCTVY